MLLMPFANSPFTGSILALSSTLAGNLLIIGSLVNIIVVSQAARRGININWKKHAAVGIPITFLTLAFAAIWLYANY